MSCFHSLATVHKAAVNVDIQASGRVSAFGSFGRTPRKDADNLMLSKLHFRGGPSV